MFKRILRKIPGFRTGHKGKMVLATFGYLFVIIMLLNPSGVTTRDKLLYLLTFLIVFGIPFILITDLGDIRNRLPIFNQKTKKSNFVGIFVTLLIMSACLSFVDSMKSDQQRQLDLLADEKVVAKKESEKEALDFDSKVVELGDINKLTYSQIDTVIALRKEYDELSVEQKGYVTKLEELESAEIRIENLGVEIALALDTKIEALGVINSINFDKADTVLSLRVEYETLNSEQKELITKLSSLELAEEVIAKFQVAEDKKNAEIKAAEDKKIAEKKAVEDYENWIEGQFSIWDGSNKYLVKLLKEHLNDPKSFKHVETVYWDKGTYIIVKMTYRANNAFGALILQNVTAKSDYINQTISIISQND